MTAWSKSALLKSFEVDAEYGFLPKAPPALHLPERYAAWDQMADLLSPAIRADSVRRQLDTLPLLLPDTPLTVAEQERAMLLLSGFAHAYIFGASKPVDVLPSSIAIPWDQIANQLGRPPILTHASVVLNNWRLLDPKQPFELDNLATLLQFDGSSDESWFYLLTTYMEKAGAPVVIASIDAILAAQQSSIEALERALEQMATGIDHLRQILLRMRERCDPYIFYLRVRPYLASFRQILYQGVSEERRNFAGGSAAQSTMLQVFDATLGVQHQGPSKAFLLEMRRYMPPRHAAFIEWIEENATVRAAIQNSTQLQSLHEHCLQQLAAFRDAHLQIVADYVFAQVKNAGPGNQMGTGGTPPMRFLQSVRENTRPSK